MADGHTPIIGGEPAPFCPKLAAALCAISGGVKQLGKTEKNKFAKYDFVSVDKFYASIGPLMADAGVHCIPDCIESEVVENMKSGKPLLRERWAFLLIHESGGMAGPFHRTVTVPAEGAQAHGSSESYAQKQFLRGVFRVPTGDKDDPDLQEAQQHAPARKSTAQAKRDGDFEKFKAKVAEKGRALGADGIRTWVASDDMTQWFGKFSKAFADGMRDEAEAQAKALEQVGGRQRQSTDIAYKHQGDIAAFVEYVSGCTVPSEIRTEAEALKTKIDNIQATDRIDDIAEERISQLEGATA